MALGDNTIGPNGYIEKRHVRSKNQVYMGDDHDGNATWTTHQVDDYVPVEHLDAYVANQRRNGWAFVQVLNPDEHNPGPGGNDGHTAHHGHLYTGRS